MTAVAGLPCPRAYPDSRAIIYLRVIRSAAPPVSISDRSLKASLAGIDSGSTRARTKGLLAPSIDVQGVGHAFVYSGARWPHGLRVLDRPARPVQVVRHPRATIRLVRDSGWRASSGAPAENPTASSACPPANKAIRGWPSPPMRSGADSSVLRKLFFLGPPDFLSFRTRRPVVVHASADSSAAPRGSGASGRRSVPARRRARTNSCMAVTMWDRSRGLGRSSVSALWGSDAEYSMPSATRRRAPAGRPGCDRAPALSGRATPSSGFLLAMNSAAILITSLRRRPSQSHDRLEVSERHIRLPRSLLDHAIPDSA